MTRRRITVDMEEATLNALDQAARDCHLSRNQFLLDAVKTRLRERERQNVDASFARMAHDPDYRNQVGDLEQELFSASDAAWQRIDVAEKAP